MDKEQKPEEYITMNHEAGCIYLYESKMWLVSDGCSRAHGEDEYLNKEQERRWRNDI